MADNKITIDINLNANGEGEANKDNVAPQQAPTTPKDAKESSSAVATSMARQGAMYIGKQAVNWGLQNYGNLTGDYLGQTQIQTGLTIAGMGLTIMKSPVLGSIAVATNLAVQTANYYITRTKADQEAQQLRTRVGAVISSGGRDL